VKKSQQSPSEIVRQLEKIVGREYVASDTVDLLAYTRDASPMEGVVPMAVVKVGDSLECSRVLSLANELGFKVYVRGGGTSAGGGGIAFQPNSVILDTTRMNRILEIDERNMSVTVQPGVIWSTLNEELAKRGLRVPFMGPESAYGATVGGSIALASMSSQGVTESGGTFNQVLSLEVVLPTGEITRVGSDALPTAGKYARVCCGGDFAGLFIGSMGVFGVITEATLRLEELPTSSRYIGVVFESWEQGLRFVQGILRKKLTPKSLNITPGRKSTESSWGVAGECGCRIVIEEPDDGIASRKAEAIISMARELGGVFPTSHEQNVENWWKKMFLRLVSQEREKGFAAHACHWLPVWRLPEIAEDAEKYFHQTWGVEEYGMKVSIGAYVADQRPAVGFSLFLFYRDDRESRLRAREIWEKWLAHIVERYGAVPYWMGMAWTRALMTRVRPEYRDFLRRLKRSLDPNDVLNPGMLV